jgi:1,4-dihydroxy-2-naphthoate octaprenyltransferase
MVTPCRVSLSLHTVSESNAFLRVRGILSRPGRARAARSLRETAEMATRMMRTLKETTKFVSLYETLLVLGPILYLI